MPRVDRHFPKVEGGTPREEKAGKGRKRREGWMGWEGICSQCLAQVVEGEVVDVGK